MFISMLNHIPCKCAILFVFLIEQLFHEWFGSFVDWLVTVNHKWFNSFFFKCDKLVRSKVLKWMVIMGTTLIKYPCGVMIKMKIFDKIFWCYMQRWVGVINLLGVCTNSCRFDTLNAFYNYKFNHEIASPSPLTNVRFDFFSDFYLLTNASEFIDSSTDHFKTIFVTYFQIK